MLFFPDMGRYLRPFFALALVLVAGLASAQFAGNGWPVEMTYVNQSPPQPAPAVTEYWEAPNPEGEVPFIPYVPAKGVGLKFLASYYPGTEEVRPTGLLIRRTMTGPSITGSVNVNFVQTHYYVGTDLILLPSARTVTGTSTPMAGNDVSTSPAVAQFYGSVSGDANAANRTGRFEMRISTTTGEGVAYNCAFVIKGTGAGWAPTDPNLGNQPGQGANDPTPEGQRNFWTNLWETAFVPSEESADAMADSWNRFRYWGPYGLASSIHDRMVAAQPETTPPGGWDNPYKLYLGTIPAGMGVPPMTIEIDAAPYAPTIRIVRMLILAVLIWQFGMNLHRFLAKGKQDDN